MKAATLKARLTRRRRNAEKKSVEEVFAPKPIHAP